jgi:signal peptidase II
VNAVTEAPISVRTAAFARAAVVAAIVLALDQLTKHTLATGIAAGEEKKFLPGVNLVHVRNTGVAFSIFSGGGTLVLVFTLVALAVLLAYFARHPARPWLWIPTGMLVGGAIGNLIDRVAHGAVTDFIKLPHWPAFNVADMSITFGVLVLLWVLEGRREQRRPAATR